MNPHAPLRKDLLGGRRGIQVQYGSYNQLAKQGFDPVLLYKRGDDVNTALARLASIEPDPEAGAAPRDFMLPAFEGLEKRLPKPFREAVFELVDTELIGVSRLDLPDHGPTADSYWAPRVDIWWTPGGARWRAAHAALGYFAAAGRDLDTVEIHDKARRSRFAGDGPVASARFGITAGIDQSAAPYRPTGLRGVPSHRQPHEDTAADRAAGGAAGEGPARRTGLATQPLTARAGV